MQNQAAPASTDPGRGSAPPLGQHYEVAGRRLALHRSGSGGPAVVVLPGAGLVGLDFWNIHQRIAGLTTSVLYDRGGTGWSDPVALPRSAAEVAGELRDLLAAAGVAAPLVLAGHSLGACYARRYAQLYPGEVAGLMLLEPGHEDIMSYLPPQAAELAERMKAAQAQLTGLTDEQVAAARAQLGELYASWPAAVRGPLIDNHLGAWRTAMDETANLETDIYAELRDGGPLPDVPLIVLTATGINPFWAKFAPAEVARQAQQGVHAMHAAMAAAVPRGEHRLLPGASHQIAHVQQPDAVVQAVADVLSRSRA